MRILLLAPHPFFQPRGTPLAERMLVEALTAQGHEVEVLTFHEGDDPQVPGCRIHRIPQLPLRGIRPGFSLKKLVCDAVMLGKLFGMIRRRRFDLIHAVEESAFMALLVRRLAGIPYVYDMDSGLAQQMADRFPFLARLRPVLDTCERMAVRGSVGTLAVCAALEEQARAWHPDGLVARLEDVSLLTGEGDPADLHPPGWNGAPLVLYVGNLEPYQGIDLLLAGFARAVREVPAARLAVVGGEPAAIERYRRLCRSLGIDAAVHFAGPRPVSALGACLRRATVLVSPRIRGTNTPMKVYSYLDSGRALLATRLPTHTQVLHDGIAHLVDPTPEALGQGLVRLLEDETLRERLGAEARRHAQRELTREAFQRKLRCFYQSLEERIAADADDADDPAETARLQARHQSPR